MKWRPTDPSQSQLETILKHKGIGPVGSKSLKEDQLNELTELLKNPLTSHTTQASLFAAFSLLPNQEIEEQWFAEAKQNYFAPEVRNMLEHKHPLSGFLKRVISRDALSYSEAKEGINHLLDPECPEYLKGAFLEALRVRRETHDENLGFLHQLFERASHTLTKHPILIDIADNYDGYNRTPCLSPFVAAVIAAAGFPVVIHGCEQAAPKMGKTSWQVLSHAGYPVTQSIDEAIAKLEDPNCLWTFIDQEQSFPELFALHNMRKEMVKRPMIATFEKMLQPIRAQDGNHLAMGYTHTAYKGHLSELIKVYKESPKALIVRGTEGTSRPSLSRRTTALWFDGLDVHEEFFDPKEFDIEMIEEGLDKEANAEDSLEIGLAVLNLESDNYRAQIELWAISLIAGFRLATDQEAVQKVREAIDSKLALKHFYAFKN